LLANHTLELEVSFENLGKAIGSNLQSSQTVQEIVKCEWFCSCIQNPIDRNFILEVELKLVEALVVHKACTFGVEFFTVYQVVGFVNLFEALNELGLKVRSFIIISIVNLDLAQLLIFIKVVKLNPRFSKFRRIRLLDKSAAFFKALVELFVVNFLFTHKLLS
jgi:hypothetical protein